MLNKELQVTLNLAYQEAREKRHEFMTVEHLLLALLDNSSAFGVLRACGADLKLMRSELVRFVDETTPVIPLGDKQRDTQPTLGFQRVLQRAAFHVQSAGKKEVTGANVLAAIFGEQDSQANYVLKKQDISRLDVVNYISHGISRLESQGEQEEDPIDIDYDEEAAAESQPEKTPLEIYANNLNEQALSGKIDPLIGRDAEIERTVQILCRRRKNNPLLVGEAGVGKTAIAEGLAKRIVEGEVPDVIKASTVYALDMGAILAGTKYRGDFEKRIKAVLREVQEKEHAILFIDEIHTMIGAGATSGGAMDASNLLKPLLASGDLKCIGATTYQEYRGIFEKDRALSRRFQKIDVEEPSTQDAVAILEGLRTHFESHHDVKFTKAALKAAVDLSARYITDRYLPDKAIDVIDEAGARQRLKSDGKRKKTIGVHEIEEIVSKMTRIPPKQVTVSDVEALKSLESDLKLVVFGQDEPIEQLAAAIKMARSGLGNPDKPIGSFLFTGPTGVGKTEVTRQLAYILGIELIRFDMSEYMERHTVSRLIGAPPGYVGFDQGGLLTEAVSKHPYAVVLLDEIEKAHPDVFNLLLQVMDHGSLTDTNGRRVDFRNVILVMTSNAGAQEISRRSMGFAKQDHSTDASEVITRMFTPEFRNRLDAIIQFNHLTEDTIQFVVEKFISKLQAQLEEKQVELVVEEPAKHWIATRGYDAQMGARPMERVIQEKIKRPLADEILFGKLAKGGEVTVSVEDDELQFLLEAHSPSATKIT